MVYLVSYGFKCLRLTRMRLYQCRLRCFHSRIRDIFLFGCGLCNVRFVEIVNKVQWNTVLRGPLLVLSTIFHDRQRTQRKFQCGQPLHPIVLTSTTNHPPNHPPTHSPTHRPNLSHPFPFPESNFIAFTCWRKSLSKFHHLCRFSRPTFHGDHRRGWGC